MELKQGDLVVDYEGDLTLIVENGKGELVPITLNNRTQGCVYYDTIQRTIKEFLDSNNGTVKVLGNVKKALLSLNYELPK